MYLAEHAARYRGVMVPDGPMGAQLAHLVRGGCTLAPDAYLFTVIDRAILAEQKTCPSGSSSCRSARPLGPRVRHDYVSLIMTCLA